MSRTTHGAVSTPARRDVAVARVLITPVLVALTLLTLSGCTGSASASRGPGRATGPATGAVTVAAPMAAVPVHVVDRRVAVALGGHGASFVVPAGWVVYRESGAVVEPSLLRQAGTSYLCLARRRRPGPCG